MVSAFDAWVADLGIPLLAEFHGDPVGVDHYYPDGTFNGTYKAIVGDERNEEIPTADGQGWRRARTRDVLSPGRLAVLGCERRRGIFCLRCDSIRIRYRRIDRADDGRRQTYPCGRHRATPRQTP